ncbi:MAG TPA: lysoplasmalogenase family protein [Candidatus Thermoplasmatota archaeon]|nr:lysoplasmalogenase family protein [Candidatus Thermoplasmatota archaeon]
MHGASTFFLAPLYAALVVALILAERAGSRAGMWATKPLTSLVFVAMGLSDGLPDTSAGRLLLTALVFSFAGDLCLIPTEARVFRAGILLFLLAHVAFVGAFLALGVAWAWAALALLPLAGAAWRVARWILRGVPHELRRAVVAYVVVITAMVATAAGAVAAGASPLLLVAALAFWTNDILVARDRFVTKTWVNRAMGLPLYYGAMLLFALHVA